MPQARDQNGEVISGVFDSYGTGQVVAYTGTAGTIAQGVSTVQATATLTSNNTNVTAADTVTIGNKVYTFVTPVGSTEGNVLIGANADASLLNLIRAINHTGTPDTDYKCAAAHTQVSAAASVTAHAFAITALVGGADANEYALATDAVTLSWSSDTLVGGADDARGVRFVRAMLTTVGFISIGASPTATTSSIPMAAGVPAVFAVQPGDKVSAVQSASGGNLHVIEVI